MKENNKCHSIALEMALGPVHGHTFTIDLG